jgi:hypothetical protein
MERLHSHQTTFNSTTDYLPIQRSAAMCPHDNPSFSRYRARIALGTCMVFAAMAAMAQRPAPAVIGGGGGSGGTTAATTYYEQGHLLRAGEEVEALGPNLMGDTVNEYSGNLSFTQSDFNIPGNNALQMAVARDAQTVHLG